MTTAKEATCKGPGKRPGELCGRPKYGRSSDCDAHTKQRERDKARGGKGDDSCLRPIGGPGGRRVGEVGTGQVDISTRLDPEDAETIGDLGRRLGGKGNGYFAGAQYVLTQFARKQLVLVDGGELPTERPTKRRRQRRRKSAA